MTCAEAEGLTGAYADGELSLDAALAFEAHAETCAACRARIEEAQALKRALQLAPYYRAPESLVRHARGSRPRANRVAWLVAAASIAIIGLGSAAVLRERMRAEADRTAGAVIDGHVRSLMASHLTDVTSTDRHTVKPWFAGRLDFSPTVIDLAAQGFPLAGGRVDYIDRHPAAALVYMRRAHAINVFLWPQSGGSASHIVRADARGYHVISWAQGGMAVWIVSDLALPELDEFASRLDAAITGG